MEAISGAAAVLQLVDLLGKSVLRASRAYADICNMDETTRDFDSQLNATRVLMSVMKDIVHNGTLSDSMKTWWNETDILGLLKGFEETYERLSTIFTNISYQKSSIAGLRSYIKLKHYDGDIRHLRLCINTYISALQLPVLIQSITAQMSSRFPQDGIRELLEDLANRMANLEAFAAHAQQDLMGITCRRKELAQVHVEFSKAKRQKLPESGCHPTLNPAEIKQVNEMEDGTRAMLDITKRLVSRVRDYATTLDSGSTSSKSSCSPSFSMALHAAANASANATPHQRENRGFKPLAVPYPKTGLPIRTPISGQQRDNITVWAEEVDFDGGDSALFTSSRASSRPAPSTVGTSDSASSFNTTATSSGQSILAELHQRRLRTAENLMKGKEFEKAIPHLDRLLYSHSDLEDIQQKGYLARELTKALVEVQPVGRYIEYFCQKYPEVKAQVSKLRLAKAVKLREKNCFAEVISLLQMYDASSSGSVEPTYHNENEGTATWIDIQIEFAWALARSNREPKAISILESILELGPLPASVEGKAQQLLAETYYAQCDWGKAKEHGLRAVEVNMAVHGRDDSTTTNCISLMADACYYTLDVDEDLWREMVHTSDHDMIMIEATSSAEVSNRIRSCCQDMLKTRTAGDATKAADIGVKYLQENYFVDQPLFRVLNPVGSPCWGCIKAHILSGEGSLAGFKEGVACQEHTRHTKSDVGIYTGLSPLHFLVTASPRQERWPGRQTRSCAEEIAALLKLSVSHPATRQMSQLINAPTCYEEEYTTTPIWLAAVNGRKTIVDFLLSLKATKLSQGIGTFANLCFVEQDTYALDLQNYEQYITALFDKLSSGEAGEILTAKFPHPLPWYLYTPSLLDILLKKYGQGSRGLHILFAEYDQQKKVPYPLVCAATRAALPQGYRFFDSPNRTACPKGCTLRNTWTLSMLLPAYKRKPEYYTRAIDILTILLKHGANGNTKDPEGETPTDFVVDRLLLYLYAALKPRQFYSPIGDPTPRSNPQTLDVGELAKAIQHNLAVARLFLRNGGRVTKINLHRLSVYYMLSASAWDQLYLSLTGRYRRSMEVLPKQGTDTRSESQSAPAEVTKGANTRKLKAEVRELIKMIEISRRHGEEPQKEEEVSEEHSDKPS